MRPILFNLTDNSRPTSLSVLCLVLLSLSPALPQTGGDYVLSWSTIDGGGGESVGGSYVITGTIGQPDAGEMMMGGNFALSGGFWFSPPCFVDMDELADFLTFWLWDGSGLAADFNGDQSCDIIDMAYLSSYWLNYCPHDWSL